MSENDTSIESKPWYKNVSAMLKLSATFLAVAGSAITLYLNLPDKPSADKAQTKGRYSVVVLDASESMAAEFPAGSGNTKFQVVTDALLAKGYADADQVAVRIFGAESCQALQKSEKIVGFGAWIKNSKNILERLNKITPEGKATLTNAISNAIYTDLNSVSADLKEHQELFVIAGSAGDCKNDLAELKRKLEADGIQFEINLIGVDLANEQKRQFRELADITGGRALFARDNQEFQFALRDPSTAHEFTLARDIMEGLYPDKTERDAEALFGQIVSAYRDNPDYKSWVARAMAFLGDIHYTPLEPHDQSLAFDWFQKSWQHQENGRAAFCVGRAYQHGKGVARDMSQAQTWYEKASELGYEEAKLAMRDIR